MGESSNKSRSKLSSESSGNPWGESSNKSDKESGKNIKPAGLANGVRLAGFC